MKKKFVFSIFLIFIMISSFAQEKRKGFWKRSKSSDTKLTRKDMYGNDPDASITPEGYPLSPQWGIFPFASFIYWTARETELDYATVVRMPGTGSIALPNWQWNPGFKVGIGSGIGKDGWEVLAQYTWLHSRANSSVSIPLSIYDSEQNTLRPIFSDFFSANSASAKWKLRFNVLDTELARNFFVSPFLLLRPFMGLKGAWQMQKYVLEYQNEPDSDTVNLRQNTWAVGPRAGLNTTWHFIEMFSFFANFALSELWNDFSLKRKTNTEFVESSDFEFKYKKRFNVLLSVIELVIGARFDIWFWDNSTHFSFEAGWETQYWFSQNQLINPTRSGIGDLTLQGLTLQARFDF